VVNCDEQVRLTFLDLYTTEGQNLDADTTAVQCGVIGAYAHLHLAYPSAETNERKPNPPLNVHGQSRDKISTAIVHRNLHDSSLPFSSPF